MTTFTTHHPDSRFTTPPPHLTEVLNELIAQESFPTTGFGIEVCEVGDAFEGIVWDNSRYLGDFSVESLEAAEAAVIRAGFAYREVVVSRTLVADRESMDAEDGAVLSLNLTPDPDRLDVHEADEAFQ